MCECVCVYVYISVCACMCAYMCTVPLRGEGMLLFTTECNVYGLKKVWRRKGRKKEVGNDSFMLLLCSIK